MDDKKREKISKESSFSKTLFVPNGSRALFVSNGSKIFKKHYKVGFKNVIHSQIICSNSVFKNYFLK